MLVQDHIRRQVSSRTILVVQAALLLALGCAREPAAPVDLGPASFVMVSGDGQSGVVGTELAQPVVVKATKGNGQALAGVTVVFRVTSGGGSVFAGAATTGTNGIAQDYWTLGTSTAELQQLEVRAVLSTGQKQVYGVFTATPLAGPAAQIAIQAGDGQTASSFSNVPIAPAVLVNDQYGNHVPGWGVTFAVTSGGGSVTGGNATTNAGGLATVGSWTLGPAGSNTLTATAAGSGVAGNPVTFTAVAVGDVWTAGTSMPTARYGIGAAEINGIVYAVGGATDNTGAVRTVEAYNPATDIWTTKASMPQRSYGPGVAAINGILYVVGGSDPANFLAIVQAYDPATDTWAIKASMPTARAFLGVAAINGILYAVGGKNASHSKEVEAYDPAADRWTTKAPIPVPREGLGVAVINGTLYAVGGLNLNSGLLNSLHAYDPATDTWATKGSMPTAREGLGVAAISGSLYAVGGQTPIQGTVETYDPATNTWTTKASMPTARWGLGVAAINGVLYAVGGFDGTGPSTAVQAYRP